MPLNALPDVSSYPLMTVALMTLMGSLVAPFMEEAGFRGYFQVALERELRGPVAVMVSSLVFAFAHYAHGILWPKLLVYFLAGIAFGVTAYLTNSTLPAILPHMIGDLTFFTLVWPHDAARRLVLESGTDNWFWIHVAQAVVFTMLAVWAFQRLARVSSRDAPSKATNLELHKAAASYRQSSAAWVYSSKSTTAQVRAKATLYTAARQSRFPNPTVSPFRKYMALPCVAKLSA